VPTALTTAIPGGKKAKMLYRTLGSSGIEVSVASLGGANWTAELVARGPARVCVCSEVTRLSATLVKRVPRRSLLRLDDASSTRVEGAL